ncbi:MAG: hypothetical protein Q4C64_04140 [Erysipelotrichia bacterium]|nr:hypothetical protein [Erysipelotrichia bacterium]
MDEFSNVLREQIAKCYEDLSTVRKGSEEYTNICKSIQILRRIQLENNDNLEKELEHELKVKEEANQKRHEDVKFWVDKACTVFGGAMKLIGISALTIMVLKYEEQGALRSKVWAWVPKLWSSKI